MVYEFYPHYTKIAISWYQMGLRKKHNGFAAFGFFKPGQVWWCPISCEESHQPGITYIYAIYYTFAILCFDVLVLIFVGRSWRSSGSQDWPKFDVGMAVRVGSARRSWRFLICLAGGLLFVNALLSLLPSFALPSALADGHRSLVDQKTLETDRYRPITIFNLEEVAKRFPRPSVVFSEHFKWCGQPLFSTSSILFPSISINDVGKQPTNISHASAILQPFFSHSSAICPQVGRMSGWHSLILLGISLQG